MSKKTRSQKIIADLRRKVKLTQLKTESTKNEVEKNIELKKELPNKNSTKIFENQIKKLDINQSTKNLDPTLISPELSVFIKKDLFKTFFLSSLIICIVILLYWSFELNGQKIIVDILSKKF